MPSKLMFGRPDCLGLLDIGRIILPLDDPMFLRGGIAVNYEGEIYVTTLKKAYDALLLFPLA